VTLIDGLLAAAVLVGLALNSLAGLWWADPLAGYVLVYYALREVRLVRAGWERADQLRREQQLIFFEIVGVGMPFRRYQPAQSNRPSVRRCLSRYADGRRRLPSEEGLAAPRGNGAARPYSPHLPAMLQLMHTSTEVGTLVWASPPPPFSVPFLPRMTPSVSHLGPPDQIRSGGLCGRMTP
jgi:hypothetical protein